MTCPTVLFIYIGRDWWQSLDELQLKLKWRKKQTRRIRKTFFLIIDFLSYSESLSFNTRSLFNCAHSVAFQNQLIVISFILRCLSARSSFGLPDRPQGNNNEMLLCFERRTEIVWLPVFAWKRSISSDVVWTEKKSHWNISFQSITLAVRLSKVLKKIKQLSLRWSEQPLRQFRNLPVVSFAKNKFFTWSIDWPQMKPILWARFTATDGLRSWNAEVAKSLHVNDLHEHEALSSKKLLREEINCKILNT